MPARARLALMVAATLVLVAALVIVLATSPDSGRVAGAQSGFAGSLRPPTAPAGFALRDQDGRRVTLAGYRGEVVIVSFMYTTCEESCPVAASQIRGALDLLGRDVPAVAISVDPANDTALRAQRFLARRHLTKRMRFLLGSRRELAGVWRNYGIQPQSDHSEHSGYVVLVDRAGRQRIGFPVDRLTPEGLAHDLRRLSAERPN